MQKRIGVVIALLFVVSCLVSEAGAQSFPLKQLTKPASRGKSGTTAKVSALTPDMAATLTPAAAAALTPATVAAMTPAAAAALTPITLDALTPTKVAALAPATAAALTSATLSAVSPATAVAIAVAAAAPPMSSPDTQKACKWKIVPAPAAATAASDALIAATTAATASAANTKAAASAAIAATTTGTKQYDFNGEFMFPIWRHSCDSDAQNAFWSTSNALSVGSQVKYLYNPAQSTNQISADLMTLNFVGVQLILAGTASASTAQPSAGTGTSAPNPTQSVSTIVSKLQQGGDFNLRVPIVIGRRTEPYYAIDIRAVPNLGFSINSNTTSTATPTVTEATNETGYIPLEVTFTSPTTSTSALKASFYANAEYGLELIGADLQKTIGTPKNFGLGQFAAGVVVSDSLNIGFQYFVGPKAVYCTVTSTGCTAPTGSTNGLHLVVSFSK